LFPRVSKALGIDFVDERTVEYVAAGIDNGLLEDIPMPAAISDDLYREMKAV